MVAIICDRCREVIGEGDKVGYIAWNFREGAQGELVQDNPFETCHFCSRCMEGVKEYIEGKLQFRINQNKSEEIRINPNKSEQIRAGIPD